MELFWTALALLGGVSLFLFGMNLMGEGLEQRAGSRLKGTLERVTSNRIRAFLLGAGATAAIQSSSAVTVMVIGFVNSGLMSLHQSIGIIMGANVGTTFTSWILSLTGIEGDVFFLKMLKPSSFVPILAVIGVWLYAFAKKGAHKRTTGQILLGFSVLIYGLEIMSDSVAPLAELPEFTRILLLFQNPLFGVLAGAFLTAIIQSSSASVGILQALSATGGVTFATAIPIIMGQNIGTCVTSLLSSAGTSLNAKRAAFVHLYFNVIGTVALLSVFYLLNFLYRFSFLQNAVTPFSIAAIHTAFNVASTVLLLPFASGLEKLVVKTVRGHKTGTDLE